MIRTPINRGQLSQWSLIDIPILVIDHVALGQIKTVISSPVGITQPAGGGSLVMTAQLPVASVVRRPFNKSFFPQTIREWNQRLVDVKEARSVGILRTKLRNILFGSRPDRQSIVVPNQYRFQTSISTEKTIERSK
jgi:hypothetical protein